MGGDILINENEHVVQKRSVGQILLAIIKFVGFVILSTIPAQVIIILIINDHHFSNIVNGIFSLMWIFLISVIAWFLWNRYYKYSGEKAQKMSWADIGYALGFFLITRLIAIVGTLLISWIHGEESTANDEILMSIANPEGTFAPYYILFLLAVGMLVPIIEELAFRGIGTHLLFKKHTYWLPLIVTSTIFGFMHNPTNVISFLLYGSIGVVFFIAYQRRKNILDSMLVHILHNGIGAALLLVMFIVDLITQ